MKKKIFSILMCSLLLISLTGCGDANKAALENDYIKIDGIYVDESFEDKDLSLVYLFYTVKANDENVETSSNGMTIKINDKNEYSSKINSDYIPKYTNYYYSDIIKKIYVGKTYQLCTTFEVAKGDLTDNKSIQLINSKIKDIDKLNITTAEIKSMENLAKISEDLDKTVYETKYNEEQDKLADVDSKTEAKVKKDINGYYFEGYVNIGTTIKKCKVEFKSPNKFTVSLAGLSNSGTYKVKKGVITLDYGNGPKIFLEYEYEDGDIVISNLSEEFGTLIKYDPLGEEE